MTTWQLRTATEDDYPTVLTAVADWWGDIGGQTGPQLRTALLPRLFFQHFTDTSLIATDDHRLAGFLVGLLSQTHPDQAYIHFAGVRPGLRRSGLGRLLYGHFFDLVRARGRTRIHAITSVENTRSQAFHRRLGFTVSEPIPGYEGPHADRVVFTLDLPT